jgi:small subunit ribosomal protein S6
VRPYESMIIFDAELEEPAIAAVLDRSTELIRSGGGERGSIDRWGKRAFAYEMRHRREGYYVVMEYTAEPAVAAEIDRLLHLADEVIRHKTVRLPDSIKVASGGKPAAGGGGRAGRAAASKAGRDTAGKAEGDTASQAGGNEADGETEPAASSETS